MTEPVNINAVPKLNLGLQETDEVFISRGGSGPYRVPASSFPWEQKGDKGDPGGSWAPVLSLVTDGVRLVHRVVDWVGGTGEKPTALGYVGAAGFVAAAADAVDLRGTAGVRGWSPVLAVVEDGVRRVQQVVDWTGGAGTKPTTLGYVGATGLVDTAAAAVDVRGAQGGAGWAPVLAVVADGERRVQQIVDWTDGAGTKPTSLGYVGAAGIVATAAAAMDVRGAQGVAGWAPMLAVVADGERRVQRVVDWTGGAGTKPATLGYVGAAGIVATAAAAVDVRGPQGVAGWAPVLSVVADGERRVHQVVDWTGGAGTKPTVLGYIGAAGIVATAAAAVDVRGVQGAISDAGVHAIMDVASASGLAIAVKPFRVLSFWFSGGNIGLPAAGSWYIGVEMWSGQLRCLPRLGHRGWIPVALAICTDSAVTDLQQIKPQLPDCRIPRTMSKLISGDPVSVVVMGSSLLESSSESSWAGMVFGATSDAEKYRLPTTVTLKNVGLGGTPNQYQLAQLGFASGFRAALYPDSGYPLAITGAKLAPNGRSSIFEGVDVVVIGMLANGGEYRLECIEPIIRNLRKSGVEVIVATDNAQNPSVSYVGMTSAALYSNGPYLMRIADLYGVEVADTAAYVAEAHLRAAGVGVYADSIHMTGALPAGADLAPASGHEVWARAVRSIFPVRSIVTPTSKSRAWTFDGDLDGVVVSGVTAAAVSANSGSLVITKTAASGQWGAKLPVVGAVKNGDTVVVSGVVAFDLGVWGVARPTAGLQGGGAGWGGTQQVFSASGNFNFTLTATRDASDSYVLLFGNWDAAPIGTQFSFDSVVVTVNNAAPITTAVDQAPGRQMGLLSLPAQRLVADLKTPGDAFVILPEDEDYARTGHASAGVLSAHPAGANSFARRFSAAVSTTADMLVLTSGKRACISAMGVVGFSAVIYSVAGNPEATLEVRSGGALIKTINLAAQTLTREIYLPIRTPTEMAVNTADPRNSVVDLVCISGTVNIAALVALTSDHELLPAETASRVGAWTNRVSGGAPGMPGYATDTAGDYAVFRAPDDARRVSWICTAKSVGKPVDTWSGRTKTLAQATSGVNHVYVRGGHVGPGDLHVIRCAETLVGGGSSTSGYALHIGGLVVVRDR